MVMVMSSPSSVLSKLSPTVLCFWSIQEMVNGAFPLATITFSTASLPLSMVVTGSVQTAISSTGCSVVANSLVMSMPLVPPMLCSTI